MREPQPPFVSVKFDAVGRPHRFLLPEIDFEPPLRAGEQVVVTRGEHLAYGTVARSVPQLAARRAAPAVASTSRVLRRVSKQDVTARLKQQHRERAADRVLDVLPKRLERFGLTMHPEKSRLVRFRRPRRGWRPGQDGDRVPRSGTFDFLGFTHHWCIARNGSWVLKQKTARDRLRRSLTALNAGARYTATRRLPSSIGCWRGSCVGTVPTTG